MKEDITLHSDSSGHGYGGMPLCWPNKKSLNYFLKLLSTNLLMTIAFSKVLYTGEVQPVHYHWSSSMNHSHQISHFVLCFFTVPSVPTLGNISAHPMLDPLRIIKLFCFHLLVIYKSVRNNAYYSWSLMAIYNPVWVRWTSVFLLEWERLCDLVPFVYGILILSIYQ